MVNFNPWYSQRCFHSKPRAWVLASDDGYRIRSRTVSAVSLCCLRPVNEIMPVEGGLVRQIKAYLANQAFLRNPIL